MFDGKVSKNKSGKELTDAQFVSLDPIVSYERDADGNVIWGDFLKFISFQEPGNPGEGGSDGGDSDGGDDSGGDSGGGDSGSGNPDNGNPGGDGSVESPGSGSSGGSSSAGKGSTGAGSTGDTGSSKPEDHAGKPSPGQDTGNRGSGSDPFIPSKPVITLSDTAGHWAQASIREAVARGFVNGYPDGSFKPNGAVTRAEFTVMLTKALQLSGAAEAASELGFTDRESIRPWAQHAIVQALQAGIIRGYEDGSFRPDKEVTRAEMMSMLARAAGLKPAVGNVTGFADDEQIPVWAKGAVAALREQGLISGRDDNRFAPQETATRAEAVTIILRLLERQ
ncbi:Endo-1,4-beta-xylanase A precursor [compost metagenome]